MLFRAALLFQIVYIFILVIFFNTYVFILMRKTRESFSRLLLCAAHIIYMQNKPMAIKKVSYRLFAVILSLLFIFYTTAFKIKKNDDNIIPRYVISQIENFNFYYALQYMRTHGCIL